MRNENMAKIALSAAKSPTFETLNRQELTRRWDSKRKLFNDDIVHEEASAYAHWTDFLISTTTKHIFFIYGFDLC